MGRAYDLESAIDQLIALGIQTISTDTTTYGEIIDTKGYESVVMSVQTATVTDGAYAITLLESDLPLMTGATAVDSSNIIGTLPSLVAADDDEINSFGAVPELRYVRLKVVSTSTSSGAVLGAQAILGNKRHNA